MRNAVKAKLLRNKFPVQGICRAGKRAAAEGHNIYSAAAVIKPLSVAAEHLIIRHNVMRQSNGLRLLQMGISRHDGVNIALCNAKQNTAQLFEHCGNFIRFMAQIHTHVKCNLVVAAASGMQLFACVAYSGNQNRFDIHMNILGIDFKFHIAVFNIFFNLAESFYYQFRILFWDYTLLAEHFCMCNTAGYVLGIHTRVKAY